MVVILVQLAAACLVPSHCCLSLSLIGQETCYGGACDLSGCWTSPLIPGQGLVRGRREEQDSGWLQGHRFTASSSLVPVRCHVALSMHSPRELSASFPLSSSLAFENGWGCWRRRKTTNFVQSESSISGRGTAKKAYNIAILQLKCPSV